MKNFKDYICPNCKKKLKKCIKGKNCYFKILDEDIPSFTKQKTSKVTNYEVKQANVFYRNFLKWLFKTFNITENLFRKKLFQDINFKKNQKVLITGVGNGDDIGFILRNFKKLNLKIYAQDLSYSLLLNCSRRFNQKNIRYNVSDAKSLPFEDNFFNHVFHFGGINLFGSFKSSTEEMERVSKLGGSITYGDEGIAPWLRNTIYSDMLINNNNLWQFKLNVKNITKNANHVNIRYLLGNCFYLINYIYEPNYKNKFNYKVAHKSPRGGSIIERYIKKKGLKESYIFKNLNKKII
jgi:ubiquinone/menaquinone biosynthesis C-methylase UbiE